MLRKLNPLLHNELRLAIVSLLIGVEDADFSFLLEHTKASKGNLSVQITKLKEAELYRRTEKLQRQLPTHQLQDHSARN